MKDMKLKFKDGVYGFIYDSMYGDIENIITEPMTEENIKFFNDNAGDYIILLTEINDIVELFYLKDKNEIIEFWDDILEVVE
jgi:hypothetical protein